jgi:lipopolysaccharide/colanic/teichoic acid biosynthesis glycosyltransferase
MTSTKDWGDIVTILGQGPAAAPQVRTPEIPIRIVPPQPLSLQNFDRSRMPTAATLSRQRVLDVVVGAGMCLVAIPVLLVLAVVCAVTLRTSPLFIAARPGRRDHELRVVKLRTLPRAYPNAAVKPEIAGHRMPALCAWMRRHHLDELPQLFEVVWGRMSLVGPRPRQSHEIDALHPEFDHLRREVRQGCTGLWQISVAAEGFLSDAADYDLFYLRNMNLRLDLWILVRTIGRLLGLARPIELADVPTWALRREPAWTLAPYPRAEPLPVAIGDDVAI